MYCNAQLEKVIKLVLNNHNPTLYAMKKLELTRKSNNAWVDFILF